MMFSGFSTSIRDLRALAAAAALILPLAGGIRCMAAPAALGVTAQSVGDAELADPSDTADWLTYGRTYSGKRYSPLGQINATTVHGLGVDWYVDLPKDVGIVSTPLVAGGVLYFVDSHDVVRAVSATTGKSLWTYDPRVFELSGKRIRVSYLHGGRGLALWKGKIYVATADGHLIAVDARSGKEIWSVMTLGQHSALYITGAPFAFHGKVLIGNAGSEFGRNRGYVSAYDAETGKLSWRFYLVPGNPAKGFENKAMAMAAKTWKGQWWKLGGGGQAWGEGFAYDPQLNEVYIGTGNPIPYANPSDGDRLFICSILALDANTGEYRWHYQETPGDEWDYDASSPMVLADLRIDGRLVKVLMQAPKNGFFYVIDRETGKVITAKPYTKVTWASKVDLKTGRPVQLRGARWDKIGSAVVSPGDWGARAWEPMSFNPQTGLMYIPMRHDPAIFKAIEISTGKPVRPTQGYIHWDFNVVEGDAENYGTPEGYLLAWDPVKQKRAWKVPLPDIWSPGTLTTGGNLVFQGRADGTFVAYDATDGRELWKYPMGLGISAPPITYAIGGRQYVALLVGWGGGWAARGLEAAKLGWAYGLQTRRLVVFSLAGKEKLPPEPPPRPAVPLSAPSFHVNPTLAEKGAATFARCVLCHGVDGVSGGLAPDLRASPVVLSAPAFKLIVNGGALRTHRMAQFDFTDEQLLELRNYIRSLANQAISKTTAH